MVKWMVLLLMLPLIYFGAQSIGSQSFAAEEKKNVVDIRGLLTNVSVSQPNQAGVLGQILVEGKVEKDTGFDKASIRITKETVIERKTKDAKPAHAEFKDLKVGQQVEAVFTGPVAESYPVQVRAKSVLILKD